MVFYILLGPKEGLTSAHQALDTKFGKMGWVDTDHVYSHIVLENCRG